MKTIHNVFNTKSDTCDQNVRFKTKSLIKKCNTLPFKKPCFSSVPCVQCFIFTPYIFQCKKHPLFVRFRTTMRFQQFLFFQHFFPFIHIHPTHYVHDSILTLLFLYCGINKHAHFHSFERFEIMYGAFTFLFLHRKMLLVPTKYVCNSVYCTSLYAKVCMFVCKSLYGRICMYETICTSKYALKKACFSR